MSCKRHHHAVSFPFALAMQGVPFAEIYGEIICGVAYPALF